MECLIYIRDPSFINEDINYVSFGTKGTPYWDDFCKLMAFFYLFSVTHAKVVYTKTHRAA